MECADGECNCGNGCQNQRFQQKRYADVSVIKTEKKGFGLRADSALQAHDFIFEYIGEVINEATFRRRMHQYDDEGIRHFYFMSLTKHEFVDATKKGNLGRFCNHSCNPNCYVDKWVVGDKLRMGIFAGRAIRAGEELVFNYNVDRYGADPQPCYCGEPNCTGFIGGKTQTERATKLPLATIEALGIDDADNWDTAVAKKPRKKKASEDDETYVNSVQARGLEEEGVTKVMAALMQCKEKWIAVKLLARIQDADDERVLHRVVRMHGYQILRTTLTAFIDDCNVVLQVLDILYKFPRLTKNKISDSKIETAIEGLAASDHRDVAAESKRLLDEWSKLETAYRIPRKKFDPAAAAANSYEERRGPGRDDDAAARPAAEPAPSVAIPKGPRSNIPQRNANFFGAQRPPPRRPPPGGAFGLPPGWFRATDQNGHVYYYNRSGVTTWERPTAPADKTPAPKGPSRAQQSKNALQEIIDSVTKETPRPSASQTPQGGNTPLVDSKPEKWRSYPQEKQMKIYENTVGAPFPCPLPRAAADRTSSSPTSRRSWISTETGYPRRRSSASPRRSARSSSPPTTRTAASRTRPRSRPSRRRRCAPTSRAFSTAPWRSTGSARGAGRAPARPTACRRRRRTRPRRPWRISTSLRKKSSRPPAARPACRRRRRRCRTGSASGTRTTRRRRRARRPRRRPR